MKLYYLESKAYFKDGSSVEYQFADGGVLPRLFKSKAKALEKAKIVCNAIAELYEEKVCSVEKTEMPAGLQALFWAEIERKDASYRRVIRVLEVETED